MIVVLVQQKGLSIAREVVVRDAREVLRKTSCLICVGVGRSYGHHKANLRDISRCQMHACMINALFSVSLSHHVCA